MLKLTADDASDLDATYEDWLEQAERTFTFLSQRPELKIVKVNVDVDLIAQRGRCMWQRWGRQYRRPPMPPEELDSQVRGNQHAIRNQLFESLPRLNGGWFTSQAPQRTRPSRHCCNRGVPCVGSLSVGR